MFASCSRFVGMFVDLRKLASTAIVGGLLVPAAARADGLDEIGPAGEIVRVATAFGFTEGPAADGRGNVYFTDIPNKRIHVLDPAGKLSLFTDESRSANGLMFTRGGKLVACEADDGAVAEWDVATKTRRVLAAVHDGKRLNAPNDLTLDAHGGLYFTDPHYNAPRPLPQETRGVYYLAADGAVTRVVENLPAPNGIMLSIDGRTLYVAPTESDSIRAYPVESPGRIGVERVHAKLRTKTGEAIAGCDGCTLDERGNLYVTTSLGVQVVSPAGEWLGLIEFPEQPANCTFGGERGDVLYATARTSVYAVPMRVRGSRHADAAK